MKIIPNSFVPLMLALIVAVAGCAPKSETPDSDAYAPAESSPETGAAEAPIREGSEPKEGGEAFAGADTAADDGVDHSISANVEFGDDAVLTGLAPEGWSQAGSIEHYNVATLYNKIDGRSELYMSYDVLGLSWVSFVDDKDTNDFLDVFLYDMRGTKNGFGIFSVEREADQPPLDVGRLGYRSGSNYYFWQGKYYGYINASRDSESNQKAGYGILVALMQRLEDTGEAVEGLDWLPTDGLIEDTIQYFKVDAMSLDFLTNTFIAAYDWGDTPTRVFVSKRESEEDAADIVTKFTEYSTDYSDSVETITSGGIEVIVADWGGGFYDAVFHSGPTVAGVSNVEGREALDAGLARLIGAIE